MPMLSEVQDSPTESSSWLVAADDHENKLHLDCQAGKIVFSPQRWLPCSMCPRESESLEVELGSQSGLGLFPQRNWLWARDKLAACPSCGALSPAFVARILGLEGKRTPGWFPCP